MRVNFIDRLKNGADENAGGQIDLDRRRFLKLAVAGAVSILFSGCRRNYTRHGQRKPEQLKLGAVKDLLSAKQHIATKKLLVIRDDSGWAALSTACTYEGCDLTFQDETLLCPCCRSLFDHLGNVLRGPAAASLSWYEISYSDGALFADSGKPVEPTRRFSTPQLEAALKKLQEKLKENPNLMQDGTVPKIIRELPDKSYGNLGDAQRDRIELPE